MGREDTFDLDRAVAEWRRPYEGRRRYRREDVDELERHLRDRMEMLVEEGMAPRTAFHQALCEVGDEWTGQAEYGKAYFGRIRQPAQLIGELLWALSVLPGLLVNYTVVAIRSFLRQKTVSFINIFGLGLGIGCAILGIAFARYHLVWDTHHRRADRIYRLLWEMPASGRVITGMSGPLGPALEEEFPEVERAVRSKHEGRAWVLTDSSIFQTGLVVTVVPWSVPSQATTVQLIQSEAMKLSAASTVPVAPGMTAPFFRHWYS